MFQIQHKIWEYSGWADTRYVKPEEFSTLVDSPHFYDTMQLGSDPTAKRPQNVDSLSVGQLLIGFFEFYGYSFDMEKLAIDIRHSKLSASGLMRKPDPFRPR